MGRWIKAGLAALLVSAVVVVAPSATGATPEQADTTDVVEAPVAQTAQTTTVRWGPFNVPANGSTDNLIAKPGGCSWLVGFFTDCVSMDMEKPCENCYVTKIIPNLVLAGTDTPVNFNNMGMLHHVVNVNWSRPDVTCAPSLFGDTINLLGLVEGGNERFFASGNERTVMSMPEGYGYYVGAGDEWGLIIDVMNMMDMDRAYEFEYTFEWVPAAEPVTPVWLDINQCGDSEVDTPAGYSDIHYDWDSTLDGTIVTIGGHVHDQGIGMTVRNATTGQMICDSRAGYAAGGVGEPAAPGPGDTMHPANWDTITSSPNPELDLADFNGHIASMRVCQPNVRINGGSWWNPGDTVEMHTTYNHDAATSGDMGIMIAFVDED